MPEVGERYLGTVVKTTTFGAFVSLLPGKDGLLHISQAAQDGRRQAGRERRGRRQGRRQGPGRDRRDRPPRQALADPGARGRRRRPSGPADADGDGVRRRRAAPATLAEPTSRAGSTRTLLPGGRRADWSAAPSCPGGLRVVTEAMPGVRSVSFGVWVGVGSRDESPRQAGRSHYLEHLLFKGTAAPRRRWTSPSAIDAVGGEMNAFTAKEYTCFYARVLDADLPLAVDVDLRPGDLRARCAPADVETERGVILEEIAMHDDDPGDVVHDAVRRRRCSATPRSAARSSARVESIEAHHAARDPRLLPAALPPARTWSSPPPATSTTPRSCAWCARRSARPASLDGDADAARGPRAGRRPRRARRPACASSAATTEQANLVLGVPGLPAHDDRRFALGVLNAALGGGMSQPAVPGGPREARPGLLGLLVHLAVRRRRPVRRLRRLRAGARSTRCSTLCRDELDKVAADGHHRRGARAAARASCAGSLVLGLEDTGSRMSRHRQGRAGLRRAARRRRAAAPRSTRSPSTTSATVAADLLGRAADARGDRPVRRRPRRSRRGRAPST